MKKKAASLVDGSFFLKRYRSINKIKSLDPVRTANDLWQMCLKHLSQAKGEDFDLCRIFYHDCLAYDKKQHNLINKRAIDFSETDQYKFQIRFLEELKKKRKIAMRPGVLEDRNKRIIKPSKTKELLAKSIGIDDLPEDDVQFDFSQKGVDIKIGLDVASISLKR